MKIISIVLLNIAMVLVMTAQTEVPLKTSLSPLAYFQGAWNCSGHFFKANREISASMTFRADLNGAWLVLRHDDHPPNQFHSVEFWGMDETAKDYVNVITDSSGGFRLFTSPGWTDDRFIWTSAELPLRQNAAQRFIFEKKVRGTL